jgi:Rrf2 family protein
MRLTLWTDYALRTLIYLGAKGPRLSTIREIVERFDISKAHLMKVVSRLGQQGYIETVRGKGGGIRLMRPPDQIGIGSVVRETEEDEEDLAVMGRLAQTGFCRIEGCCILRKATLAFLSTLDGFSLADLLAPVPQLAHSLGLTPRETSGAMSRVRLKRVYESPSPDDGLRILVDRLWPRGLSREAAKVDLWLKEIAPSAPLRRWFGHEPSRWAKFQKHYHAELAKNAENLATLHDRMKAAKSVTLLFGAKDIEHNDAVVLRDFIASAKRR